MSYKIIQTIIDPWHRVLATSGTEVTIISDHAGILIVQDLKGYRFPTKKSNVRDDPDPDKKSQKAP